MKCAAAHRVVLYQKKYYSVGDFARWISKAKKRRQLGDMYPESWTH